jgi:hypothetical protein
VIKTTTRDTHFCEKKGDQERRVTRSLSLVWRLDKKRENDDFAGGPYSLHQCGSTLLFFDQIQPKNIASSSFSTFYESQSTNLWTAP